MQVHAHMCTCACVHVRTCTQLTHARAHLSAYKEGRRTRGVQGTKLLPYDRGLLPVALSSNAAIEGLLESPARCALVRVRSAFGGFGVYYLPLPPEANYTHAATRFRRPRGLGPREAAWRGWTEHAPFNLAIDAARGARRPLLLDTSFRPTFLYASGEYWDWVSGRPPRPPAPPAPQDADPAVPWTWCPPTTLCEHASRVHR